MGGSGLNIAELAKDHRRALIPMVERTEEYGAGLAELMNPEVARNPQPIYSMLHDGSPVFRLDGVGVIVTTRAGGEEVLRDPEVFSSSTSAHDL
jgi:hypothetical protein